MDCSIAATVERVKRAETVCATAVYCTSSANEAGYRLDQDRMALAREFVRQYGLGMIRIDETSDRIAVEEAEVPF